MQYKLHLNLRQRAAFKIAILFWTRKKFKHRITEFFESCCAFEVIEARNKWREFTKMVVDEWNKDILPQQLEDELIHIVKMIGETIFNWHYNVKYIYEADDEIINDIDDIHWTPYGTIDEVQIFKSSWLDNPNLANTKIYNFACYYAMEDYIDGLWAKIPSDMRDYFYNDRIYERFNHHILAYWKCSSDDDLPNLIRYFQVAADDFNREDMREFNLIYDLNRSTEENMLRLSVYQGYLIATKYFWEKLTEEERDASVLKCVRITVMRYFYYANIHYYKSIGYYKKSQYVEICIFLMNQMSDGDKKALFNEKLGLLNSYHFDNADVKDEILSMLLSTWPWQELFISVLEDMLQHQDDNSSMLCMFLNTITKKMYEDHSIGYALKSNKYRCLLREAWIIIPASIKQKITITKYSDYKFVNNLVNVWDLDSLKLVLNDPGIVSVRDKFIDSGLYAYNLLIIEDEFEKLDKFIEEIFRSEEDKIRFRQQIDVLETLIFEGQFYLVDKLLDWQFNVPEERQSFKNKIDPIEFCEELIKMCEYKLADNLLNWRFDTKEEKKHCKNRLKNDIFTIRHICKIWKTNNNFIDKAKDECAEFLHWLMESEREITFFKKKITINLEKDESTMNCLVRLKYDGILVDFLSWCLLDDQQFQQLQRIKQVVPEQN